MIITANLTGATTPRFSTDPIALSVNHFIARRVALTSGPDKDGEGFLRPASPQPLEVMYPSLYADRMTPPARWRDYIRTLAAAFALPIFGGRSSRAVPSDDALPVSP
jgi:hypothetical protein